jgi:hypothetical protein
MKSKSKCNKGVKDSKTPQLLHGRVGGKSTHIDVSVLGSGQVGGISWQKQCEYLGIFGLSANKNWIILVLGYESAFLAYCTTTLRKLIGFTALFAQK